MKVTSLFSGAGGLDLGLHQVSPDGTSTVNEQSWATWVDN